MSKAKVTFLAAVLFAALFAADARAVAVRTFVASTGNDANTATNCPRATPCRNFAFALSVTSPGGEVVALDTAGFGGAIITQAVTITTLPGEMALVNVAATGTGITVNAGSGLVVLDNLRVSGTNAASTTGVLINSGNVIIRKSSFSELTVGVSGAGKVDIIDSYFQGNSTAIRAVGEGTDTQSFPWVYGPTSVRVEGGSVNFNTIAFQMLNPGARTCTDCTGNKYSIWAHSTANSAAGMTTNVTGNTTAVTGSGSGCVQSYDCTQLQIYTSTTNPQ